MTLEDLIAYKNFVYSEYERARDENSRKTASLAFQVASLEESIAEELIKLGKPEQACINFVSQGSMLVELNRIPEAKAAWERAKSITSKDKLKQWVDDGIKALDQAVSQSAQDKN